MKKPMLAAEASDLSILRYPLLASVKLDGIRVLIQEEGPRTRSLKEIPNLHIRKKLSSLPVGLDGEVGVDLNNTLDFRSSTSAVMSEDGEPKFRFFIFDYFYNQRGAFLDRLKILQGLKLPEWCVILEQKTIYSTEQAKKVFEEYLLEGHEGLILRDPEGLYKHGRSTLKEQGMLKVKPWKDSEGRCIGVVEEMQNTNEAKVNALGRTERSSKKAGKVGKGTIGKLLLNCPAFPDIVEVGTGLTKEDRLLGDFIGKLIKFKYVTVGGYDKPRFPVFLGIRDERDI